MLSLQSPTFYKHVLFCISLSPASLSFTMRGTEGEVFILNATNLLLESKPGYE